jgi:hypothetical protein
MELQQVFYQYLKNHTHILLRDFNAKTMNEDIFKTRMGNKGLYTSARVVNFATSRNVSTAPKYLQHTWASSDGKNNNYINHILVFRRLQ